MTIAQTNSLVAALKVQGFRVKASHWRFYREKGESDKVSLVLIPNSEAVKMSEDMLQYATPKGGKTMVVITTLSGKEFFGYSKCSTSDTFNKHTGYDTAFRRAMKELVAYLKVSEPEVYMNVLYAVKNCYV